MLAEVATVAMFGGQRLVVVEEADELVSRYRAELEDYVASPRASGILTLEMTTGKLVERHAAVQGSGCRRAGD